MTTFTVHFCTSAEYASHEIVAETAELALAAAREIVANKSVELVFGPYLNALDINEIEVFAEDGTPGTVWYDDELRLRRAADDLLTAARHVVERWKSGDLAGAVRELSFAIAKAEGGAA